MEPNVSISLLNRNKQIKMKFRSVMLLGRGRDCKYVQQNMAPPTLDRQMVSIPGYIILSINKAK